MVASETSDALLTLTLFGPMQARVQGQLLPPMRSRKGLWLLALLTLRHDRPVEREWLAGTLWPEMDQSQSNANLRGVLSDLRRALGSQHPRLMSLGRHTLLLELATPEVDVDVLTFDAAVKSGKRANLERAVALYRGPLLEGCNEEWVFQERAVREQNCLQALQELGDAALTGRDYEQAVRHYQRAVSIDPWEEAARRGWMEALAGRGDTNAALQVYREFVEVLKSDPTANPDEQTSALYTRLRSEVRHRGRSHVGGVVGEFAAPKVTGYLPHPLTDLVGREDERLEVTVRLRRSRLVTLTGVGGIGKTRLAVAVAAEIVKEYADGVWLVALEALSEGRLVAPQIASVLGVKEEPGRELSQSLIDHLRTKRLLLVLDNCEHLLEASAQVAAHLLQECVGMRILATSREALGITGETAWPVPALAVPDPQHLPQGRTTLLGVLMGYESVQLFVERAQFVQKTFALCGNNARTVAQICSQLEGIPLAIELAAARIRAMTVEQISLRLHDKLELLTGGSRTAQSRQQTLRATLDWSYALLNESERSLLRRLSVFVGGWSLEAAERVCVGEDGAEGQVLDLLTSLVEKSLVTFEERGQAEGRYHLLEMVRQYAAERLQASGEAEQVKRRHQDWYLSFAEQAEPALKTGEQEVWLTRLESEHGNMRAALAWSLKTRVEGERKGEEAQPLSSIPLRFCSALQRFWYMRAHLAEGRAWCERALQAEGAQERTGARAKVLNGTGILVWMQSDYTTARAYFEESLEIEREIGDRLGIASSLNSMGNVAHVQGDYSAARTYFEESMAIRREIEDRQGIATSLNNLGNVAVNQGDYIAAQAHYEESLAIRREIGDRQDIAMSFNNLGILALHQGDYVAAQAHYEESLAIRREIGDRKGIAASLDNLGGVAHALGDNVAARAHHEESLEIRWEIEDRSGIAITLNNLGNVIGDQGDYVTALAHYEKSLAINRQIGNRRGIANSLGNLGNVTRYQRDYSAAQAYQGESLAIQREIGDRSGIVSSLDAFAALVAAETTAFTAPVETTEVSREADVGMQRAARLWGATQALREQIGAPLPPSAREEYDRDVAAARVVLGDEAFSAAWTEGQQMTIEQAISYALEEKQPRNGL
jgi:predicted ATPase/DNA-binding SARP family transcriptional activator/Tfp pilus assembly protein PilF